MPELDAAPVAEGEQERFVDPGARRRTSILVPAFQLDVHADRGAVVQLGLADEVDFTFLLEVETLVLRPRAVGGVGRLDAAGDSVEGVVTAHADLDRIGGHGRGGHQPTDDQGGRAK